jgi:AraC family transcriptional regulator, arabinose operon regulatory protein
VAKGFLNKMKTGKLQVQISTSDEPGCRPNRKHHHNVFEMLYVLEGSTHIKIRRKKYVGNVGDLLIYYPGEDHEEQVQPGRWTVFVLRFPQPKLGAGVSFPDKRRTPPVVSLPWPERFQKLFELMLLDSKVIDAWTDIMAKAYLVQLAVLLRRALREVLSGSERPAGSERSLRIEKAIDMIHDSLTGDLSLKELARRAFMSESNFSHVFKDLTGVPPKRYAIQTRIARAKELLAGTDLSIKEIAAELGYDDPHYFSRQFRKLAGKPPSAFRKSK